MREPRERSPESSRRRRAERRQSREQLAAAAAAAAAAEASAAVAERAPTSSRPQRRARADSSSSSSSSTSSSLLNISRKSRFGIRTFFTASRVKKVKKRRSFRKNNKSSSSFDSDLAYGAGYVSRSSSDESHGDYQQHTQHAHHRPQHNIQHHPPQHPQYQQHPQHAQPQSHRPSGDDPLFGPDGRPALHRAKTDEEILALGRKLSDLARAENKKDLERAGKKRPSRMAAAAAALSEFHRHGSHGHGGTRGIGSSRPHGRHDESESDWESASDSDSDSSSSPDDGLAYGPPPESIRPPHRKSSAVDPAMFGPINSLRGFVNTPCGFRPGEYQSPHLSRSQTEPQLPLHEQIPQSHSASIEARPMRNVYPVPTSDVSRFDAVGSSSGVSVPLAGPVAPSTPTRRDRDRQSGVYSNSHYRPEPVPIQAPKPRIPVSPRVLEEQRIKAEREHLVQQGSPRERRPRKDHDHERRSAVEAVSSGALPAVVMGAAAGAAVAGLKHHKDDHVYDKYDSRREYDDHRSHPVSDKQSAVYPAPVASPSTAAHPTHHVRHHNAPTDPYSLSYDRRDRDRHHDRHVENDRHHHHPTSDARSIADIAGSAIGPAAVTLLSDSEKQQRELDKLREKEASIREERLRYERKAQRDREAREAYEKEQQQRQKEEDERHRAREQEEERRRKEEEEKEKERQRAELVDRYERQVSAQREVKYKEERRSHDERARAEYERMVREADRKREREEKRVDEKDRSREREERRRAKGKDVIMVVDDRKEVAPRAEEKKTDTLQPKAPKPDREERRRIREERRRKIEELEKQLVLEQQKLSGSDVGTESIIEAPRSEPGPSSSKADPGPSSSTGAPSVDPFQFQVPDDAFPTPMFTTPSQSIAPVIRTAEPPPKSIRPIIRTAEPSWARDEAKEEGEDERLSRRCSFEREVRDAQAIVNETNHSTIPAEPGVIAAAIAVEQQRSRSRSREPRRGRDREPVRDLVQEAANQYYREKKIAERIAEDEIRSRSPSPSPSVVDKYSDIDDPVVRIVTPPEMRHRPEKSKYAEPNADVRIDNIIKPHELARFQAVKMSGLGPAAVPVFKSRDPSAERERPMLNLVLPTPTSSPSLEKMKARQAAAAAVADGDASEEEKKQVRKPRRIINARGEMVEAPEDYNTGRVVDTDSRGSSQERPPVKLKFKKSAWGSIFAAAALAKSAGTMGKGKEQQQVEGEKPAGAEGSRAVEALPNPDVELASTCEVPSTVETAPAITREPTREITPEPTQFPAREASPSPEPQRERVRSTSRAPSTPPRRSREPLDFDDEPPSVGPKPSSPQLAQMPGSFGDDIDFTATLAAGLQSSGFDPNIVIEDPSYRRRGSPPGSNEHFYMPPSCETVTDLDFEPSPRRFVPEGAGQPLFAHAEEWETGSTPGRNSRRKRQSVDVGEVVPTGERAPQLGEAREDERATPSRKGKGKMTYDAERSIPAEPRTEVRRDDSSFVDAGDEWNSSKDSKRFKHDPILSETTTYAGPSSEVSAATSSSKKSKKQRRKSTKDAYDMHERDEPPDRPGESFQWIDREVSSMASDPIGKPNGRHGGEGEDSKSVVSLPTNGTSRSTTQNGDNEKHSFLGNAGTSGAGAGPVGAAAAAAMAAQLSRPNAIQASSEDEGPFYLERSVSYSSDTIDPEVVQREIKPAIDPQYGDLLPLPPSQPGSPGFDNPLEEHPSSRHFQKAATNSFPSTTAPIDLLRPRRATLTHTRRRSAIDLPPKTPSRTAVPVQFLIGRGSVPSSPAFRFSSPQRSPQRSPVIPAIGLTSPPKTRASARPMSWDSSREIKPLYLLQKASASVPQPENLTELPPRREQDVEHLDLSARKMVGPSAGALLQALQIDTGLAEREMRFGEPLGSGNITPRARVVLAEEPE
ncbi:hypothetical protein N0V88_004097 [Collariella sp. IMI 366227]|nr:hypothetical protein N0V88_004097 [Collariella sp. IMI 366227]